MRPKSVRLFDGLFVAGVILGLVNFILGMTILDAPDALPASQRVASGGASLIGMNAFAAVIALTLWYLVSRLRIGILRWVILLLVLVGLAALPGLFADGISASVVLLVTASLLQVLAVYFLFRPDARAWFAAREA